MCAAQSFFECCFPGLPPQLVGECYSVLSSHSFLTTPDLQVILRSFPFSARLGRAFLTVFRPFSVRCHGLYDAAWYKMPSGMLVSSFSSRVLVDYWHTLWVLLTISILKSRTNGPDYWDHGTEMDGQLTLSVYVHIVEVL